MRGVVIKKLIGGLICAALLAPVSSPAAPVSLYVCFGQDTEEWEPDRRGVVRGTTRADVIVVRNRNVVVYGRGGDDRICVLGPGRVLGGSGHDLIDGGRRSDQLAGGSGMDYLDGGSGTDRLNGGTGSDTLVGGGAADLLQGGATDPGNDYLFGGPGSDQLLGADGADVFIGGEGGDAIDGGAGGSDTIDFGFEQVGITVDLSVQGLTLSNGDTLTAIENVRGSHFADMITGTDAANMLWGGEGNDTIAALGAFDVVEGGAGADTLDGGADRDHLIYQDSPIGVVVDLEAGTSNEGDVLVGFESLLGSAYDDELRGDAGPNEIIGSRGADQLFGLAGDDTLSSGGGDAGEGQDMCFEMEGEIANCELLAPVMPIRRSSIDSPPHGTTLDREAFTTIEGTGSAGQVALRRIGDAGCYWWSARRSRMEPGHCDRPLWTSTRLRSDGSWAKQVPTDLRLVPGEYEVRSRIVSREFTETQFHAPYNLVQFRLR